MILDLGMECLDSGCGYDSLRRVVGMQVGRLNADVCRRSVLWLEMRANG